MTRRDPRLLRLIERRAPALVTDVQWARPLRIASHLGAADLPDELVTGVRVLVVVDGGLVVCTNQRGLAHPWPGGRRDGRETLEQTAVREVREETGWMLDPGSVEPIGFLHLHNMGDPNPPYPHPDTLQLVVRATAIERVADDWTDTEGYELSSRLVPIHEATAAVSPEEPMSLPFVEFVARAAR